MMVSIATLLLRSVSRHHKRSSPMWKSKWMNNGDSSSAILYQFLVFRSLNGEADLNPLFH